MDYPQGLENWLGLPWEGVLATVIATSAIYVVFLAITRIMGQRMLASLTTFDTLMALLFGGVIARTTLGPTPTLATGVVAFLTLVALHFTLGKLANNSHADHMLNAAPRLLMAGDCMIEHNMRHTNTTHIELMSALRGAGIRDLSEVAAVIMEPSGKLSIYKAGDPINMDLLEGVLDIDQIPRKYLK